VAGTIARTPGSLIPSGEPVDVSYVIPEIHAIGAPRVRQVPNSARPLAPKPLWALPTFVWSGTGSPRSPSRKRSGGIRLYLDRPWWTSGDGEQLAVILWPVAPGPFPVMPREYEPFSTQFGFDPLHASTSAGGYPKPTSFPLGTAAGQRILPELGQAVEVVGHDVAFDPARDLWYCDIDIDLGTTGKKSHWPFVRLALARYQPVSLPGAHLSPVLLADFVQLAPERVLTFSGTGSTRRVTLTGRTSTNTSTFSGPPKMRFRMERQADGVSDPDLGWTTVEFRGVPQDRTVSPSMSDTNMATWQTSLSLLTTPGVRQRIVAEELEEFYDGFVSVPPPGGQRGIPLPTTQTRIAHVDVVRVT
jgi:hypothetical protein